MLLKYELKKLLTNRMNLIAMAVGFIILGIVAIYPVIDESEYLLERGESIKGLEAIEYNQQKAKAQTDFLTDEYVNQVIREIQDSNVDLSDDDEYYETAYKYGKLFFYLMNSYRDINDSNFRPELLSEIDLNETTSFYGKRIDRIADFLNMDFSYGNYTDVEKTYWLERAARVHTPYKWGDTFVVKHYAMVIALAFYQAFIVTICLSGMFAGEYEKRVADMLLATRTGQKELVYAKLFAGILFSFGYVFLGYIIAGTGIYLKFGTDGFDLPIQLLDHAICYDMNMAQYLLLQLGLSFMCIMFTIVATLFLSAQTKSSVATTIIMFFLFLGPVYIPFSKDSGLFNHINALALVRILDAREVLKQFFIYRFGNVIINMPTMAFIVYGLISVLGIMLVRRVFVKKM